MIDAVSVLSSPPRARDDRQPINPLLAAGMMAAANLQSEGVKKRATEEAAAQPTPKYTIDPAKGTFTVKDAPVTDLLDNGAKEAAKPINDVRDLIAERFQMAKRAGLLTDEDDPYADDLEDGVHGFREGYRGSRELRASPLKALFQGVQVALGRQTPEELAAQVRRRRIAKLDAVSKPLIEEAQQQRNEERRSRSEATAEQQRGFATLNTILDNSAGGFVSPDAFVANAKNLITAAGHKWDPAYEQAARARFSVDASKAKGAADRARGATFRERFSGLRRDDVFGYKTNEVDRFMKDRFGDLQLTPEEAAQVRDRFSGMRDAADDEVRRENRKLVDQQQRDARFQAFVERSAKGTPEKPTRISYTEGTSAPADYLIDLIGDETVDQRSVKHALRWKEESAAKELAKLSREQQARRQRRTATAETADEDDLAKLDADIAESAARMRELRTEVDRVKAARAKFGATAAPAAPKYLKTATNPKTGEKVGFDGTKWVPLGP